ncbi:efflux RND transporter periplasmic adaptor subunit, partial [Methylogaea oryzae]
PPPAPAASAGQTEIRAQLSPRDETTLSAEVPAEVAKLTVRKGERFKKGQLLVAFDCAAQQAQLHKAQAVLQGAHKTYEVNQRLAKLQSASALEVELAQAKMAEAQADIALYRSSLDKCQIMAPFDGRVVDVPAHAHQYLQVGNPIMEILDDSQLDVEALVPSQWLRWLKPGARFTLQVEETGREYQTEVVTLGARIDPVSQSIAVVGRIVGPHDELLAGMSGKAVFNLPR